MDEQLISGLEYTKPGADDLYPLPVPLQQLLRQIVDFFQRGEGNKLCIVLPVKEHSAQWLALPMTLDQLKNDFESFSAEIYQAHQRYRRGEKMILNGDAIVEWDSYDEKGIYFKTKEEKQGSGALIRVKFEDIIKLKPAPSGRTTLSPARRVKSAFFANRDQPLDKLLQIRTRGNNQFIKRTVCLAGKFKSFQQVEENLTIAGFPVSNMLTTGKIDESGGAPENCPLLLVNNLSALALHAAENMQITTLIIDGASLIDQSRTNFADIDAFGIPTVLFTDLSESACFPAIADFEFKFLHLSPDSSQHLPVSQVSPFHSLSVKLNKYNSFEIHRELCSNTPLDNLVSRIHMLTRDKDNQELNTLKIYLIMLAKQLAVIIQPPTVDEQQLLVEKSDMISSLYQRSKPWLGDDEALVGECVMMVGEVLRSICNGPTEKSTKFTDLVTRGGYDYVICATQGEVPSLKMLLMESGLRHIPVVMPVTQIGDQILSEKPIKALVTGWLKTPQMQQLLTCFLFGEITFLFYGFEDRYYEALSRRNRTNAGIVSFPQRQETATAPHDEKLPVPADSAEDIFELELRADMLEFVRYTNISEAGETVRAVRIMLEANYFIFGSDTHKFMLLSGAENAKITLHNRKTDQLSPGDMIVLINTDKDLLAELVEQHTDSKELKEVKYWAGLWKQLLKEYYQSIDANFKVLVDHLRENNCIRHEGTIRSWLMDENRIGPDDDSDLISIALVTGSELLLDKIRQVRSGIRKMTGWRMKAADQLKLKIMARLVQIYSRGEDISGRKIEIRGLGTVQVLQIREIGDRFEQTDIHYVNRLLQTEMN